MINTKIKKAAALVAVAAMTASTFGNAVAATNVGTGSVTGSAALDQAIVWDDTFGTAGNATATVTGIKVTATVAPTMNVSFSTDEIALGVLTPGVESTGTLNIEVGTNAVDGSKITLRSTNGGLKHTANAELINDDDANGEGYTFQATTADDSTIVAGVAKSTTLGAATQSDTANKATEHVVYKAEKAEITEGTDDCVLTVAATAIATTSAGDYEDTLTFTITGNF